MTKKTETFRAPGLTIDYSKIGTMTIDEFKQALWTDLQVLKEHYGAKYITAPKLKIDFTDEHGEVQPLRRRHDGKPIYRMHTRHYRPACMDFDFS
jgi:hypothetical protein